jgi:hypothetical protein
MYWLTRVRTRVATITAVVLAVMIAFSGIGLALAQSTTKSLSTNFTLVNFGPSAATVTVQYTKTDGSSWAADAGNTSFTIPGNGGQKPIYQYFDSTLTSGQGSATISSNQPLGAVVQILARNQTPTSGAYSAVGPASRFYAPLILRQQNTASGLANTQIVIQNTGTSALSGATVQFVSSTGANAFTYNVPTIQAGATHYYDLVNETNLSTPFAGSATINAGSGTVSVVVNVFFGTDGLQTYVAVSETGLSNSWAVPLFNSRLTNGLSTVVSVQNLSGAAFSPGSVVMSCPAFTGSAAPSTLNLNNPSQLNNGQSYSFNPVTDTSIPAQWFGACRVTTPGNSAVIIQMRFVGTQNTAAYEAIRTSSTDRTFFTPLVQKILGNGFATNTTIVNLSNSSPANVTVTYTPSPDYVASGGSSSVLSFTTQIPAGSSLQQNHRIAGFQVGSTPMPNGWYGTLRVVSSDQPIAGFTQITNVNNPAGDTFMTYTAFTQP